MDVVVYSGATILDLTTFEQKMQFPRKAEPTRGLVIGALGSTRSSIFVCSSKSPREEPLSSRRTKEETTPVSFFISSLKISN